MTPQMKDEEEALAENTNNDQILLSCALHRVESRAAYWYTSIIANSRAC